MHPNEPESMHSGLVPPQCLGLCLWLGSCPCLGSCLGFCLGLVHFAQYIEHSSYLLRLKQQITNCFNISFFDLIQFFD